MGVIPYLAFSDYPAVFVTFSHENITAMCLTVQAGFDNAIHSCSEWIALLLLFNHSSKENIMFQYAVYCPNCDYKLWVQEEVNNYVLMDGNNGHVIHNCPNCMIPLIIIDGKLVEDKS